jgi:hypothetical protein
MSSDITPNETHAVITMRIALHSQNPDEIADGLNELLGGQVGKGWVADYAFYNSDNPLLVIASETAEEGELFNSPSGYLYPDMEKQAESLTFEHFAIDSLDDICQNQIDGVDHMVASVASNLSRNKELACAIALLENSHKNVAVMLKALVDTSLMRDHIQANTN